MFLTLDNKKVFDGANFFRQVLGNTYIDEKIVLTKDNEKIHLIHSCFYKDESSMIGVIHFIGNSVHIGKLFYFLTFDGSANHLHIEDIQFNNDLQKNYINKGIGTAALYYLEEIALSNNVSYITGKLFDIDLKDHEDRLLHFYLKNGFDIEKNEIKKSLIDV